MVVSIGLPPTEAGEWTFPSANLYQKGPFRFADVTIQETERKQLCKTLADMIVTGYQPLLLRELVKKRYFYFTQAEQKEIYMIAKSYQLKSPWRELLAQRLNSFLEQATLLHIEGFVRFRMEEYRKELEHTVDKAAEDYLVDREYQEFIGMLTCLTEIQPCLIEKVHIKRSQEGYGIFDPQYRPVVSKETSAPFGALTPEDLLLSQLITLSPKEIIIHQKQEMPNKELINTIMNVFGNKVQFCDDCSFCH